MCEFASDSLFITGLTVCHTIYWAFFIRSLYSGNERHLFCPSLLCSVIAVFPVPSLARSLSFHLSISSSPSFRQSYELNMRVISDV